MGDYRGQRKSKFVKTNHNFYCASAPVERSGTSCSFNNNVNYYYLFTLKCNNMKYTSRDDIYAMCKRVLQRVPLVDTSSNSAWEMDKRDRWHYHCIIALSREPWLKGLQTSNWTVHLKRFPVEDYFTVVNYLKKIDQNPYYLEQLDIKSQIRYSPTYGFI